MLFAATVCSAQTMLWDGEEAILGSKGGCWDDGNPTVVANPAKDAVNGSDKCLMFTMTSNSLTCCQDTFPRLDKARHARGTSCIADDA